ncbi:MAG: vWA domain-containing protein [Saprospiraceae bacterium]
MSLAAPFWLLLLLPLAWLTWRRREGISLRMPYSGEPFGKHSIRTKTRAKLPMLRWLALAFLVAAMARPQRKWEEEKIKADALDIVLSMDISPSMLSKDFDPDRLSVAKRVAADFAGKRPHDRIGLVAFSAEAFTQCPLTTDRRVVQTFINELTVGRLEDGTAIGMGLATAINRLKDSPSRSKIVVLLTDGENNAGYISPLKAAEIAQSLGVRVYTVGIGTEGVVMSPAERNPDGSYSFAPRFTKFDTQLLEEMAAATGGKFYRAVSEGDLEAIYAEIDRLEKTKIEISTVRRTTDYFHWFIGAAVFLLLIEILGVWGLLRSATP